MTAPFDHQRRIKPYKGQAPGMSALEYIGKNAEKLAQDALDRIKAGVE